MTAHPDAPRSRRERPAKPALSRSGIVATAVGLMRSEGLQRVTMRRLAQELDTGPASLYVYVRNTAELHAAVLDDLLGSVDLTPVTTPGDWQDRLVAVLTSYTDLLFAHPGLAQSALVARPSGERYLDLVEAVLALLAEGGVPGDRASWALDLLLQFATATAAEHAPRAGAATGEGTRAEEWDALAAALRGATADTRPHLAALGTELLSGSGEQRLAWGFRVLLNGVLHTPR
ncbi:TetR/AcrR family transcriptional regulator [Kitasatospora sp. DSM 101779]|uniref:TetR/AcrR family transcriptional regulator n=1 Tax=Kitasatospora sp. DSM 101779 TaxID=2853165 RepID=UPI0021DB02D6|nr:TetR/AcrR family transcriptional regulator [Kitasatospora sp. DSM 101779]MCU7820687.1 TetR/AcrR family transcriptional regulator [Kitasatospora sp. DSM 101779]